MLSTAITAEEAEERNSEPADKILLLVLVVIRVGEM